MSRDTRWRTDKGYRLLEHTADAAIEAWGRDIPELFQNAARGLTAVIADPWRIRDEVEREVAAEAPDRDALLVAWLNEFIYLFDVEHLLFRRFEIEKLTGTAIAGRAFGERVDPERHQIRTGVKSTTYHGLVIRRSKSGYTARIVFDV